jgi:hypothetical protein
MLATIILTSIIVITLLYLFILYLKWGSDWTLKYLIYSDIKNKLGNNTKYISDINAKGYPLPDINQITNFNDFMDSQLLFPNDVYYLDKYGIFLPSIILIDGYNKLYYLYEYYKAYF